MNIKNLIIPAIAACVATAPLPSQAATPEVTDVTMTQSGAGRLVTITYKLTEDAVVTLDVQTNATPNAATGWASIGGKAICNALGAVWRKVTTADADVNGNYTITWRPDLSWVDEFGNGFKIADGCAKAVVTASALDNTPNYMVVDVSAAAQPNTQKYYPAVDFLPGGLLGNQAYRTTSIVMRKIPAKGVAWTMGSSALETQRDGSKEATHQVTLANNYYIGVFEVTQSQWALIQTSRPTPSFFSNLDYRAMRPVEQVCYNEIRNAANSTTADSDYNYPNPPKDGSFLGLLRTKTGIDFDLPSEAQWEFAARAGNGSPYWGAYGLGIQNADADVNLAKIGRYQRNGGMINQSGTYISPEANCGPNNGTAIVGSYQPNDWGLYDIFGNVWEWCLDTYSANISSLNGAVNTSGTDRIRRGGSWGNIAGPTRPAARYSRDPSARGENSGGNIYGFRLACTAGLD